MALGSVGLREEFVDFSYKLIAVAGDNGQTAFPRLSDDLGISRVLGEADACKGLRALFGKLRRDLRDVTIKKEGR